MGRLTRRKRLASANKDARMESRKFSKQFLVEAEMTGDELKALRVAYRLSQKQLADILGVTVVTIKRAERKKGKEFPSRLLKSLLTEAQLRGRLKLPEGELKVPQGYLNVPQRQLKLAEDAFKDRKRENKKPRGKS